MNVLKDIINIINYFFLRGTKWLVFRLFYELKRKLNYFKRKDKQLIKLAENITGELPQLNIVNKNFTGHKSFIIKADQAAKGNIFTFSNQYLNYASQNKLIDWHYSPVTKKTAPANIPWYRLPDFGEYGDIKIIWESSRFPQIYFFINAYSVTKNLKYAKACINQIEDWIDNNPYPLGLNWKCGQEITFRLFAWYIAIDFFHDNISQSQKQKIIKAIFISILRIDLNINYAVKSVRNNHSVSEAAGLFVGGLLFPDLLDSEHLQAKGLELLLQETSYQVFDDGSYIQNSMNYHRLVLDILSFVIHIARVKQYKLPALLVERHKKLIEFLNSFIQENGEVPNYGSNDGSCLFPFSGNKYLDCRPSLNFAAALSFGKDMYNGNKELIDFFGLDVKEKIYLNKINQFNNGGYYILKDSQFFLFIRCHTYNFKPSHNDPLHLDVWYKNQNIFCDTGTYSYNPVEEIKNEFTGISGHNTIMINNVSPMRRVLNFGTTNWIKAKKINSSKNEFIGEHYGYKKLFNLTHRRRIKIEDTVSVLDEIFDIKNETNIKQIWNTQYSVRKIDQHTFIINNSIQLKSDIPGEVISSKISKYYNKYINGWKIVFNYTANKNFKIKTVISNFEAETRNV